METQDGNLLFRLDGRGDESLGWAGHVGNKGVEFLAGVLVFVTLSLDSHTDSVWNVTNALGPEVFVKLLVDTVVGCPHHELCKLLALVHSPWCPLLEATANQVECNNGKAVHSE